MPERAVSSRLPNVSILITYYNQIDYIEQSIQSAIMQDYSNLEIIISDDCSDRHPFPKNILNDRRIKYYRNTKNLGISANYRKALYEYATGDFALVLNGDDYFTDPTFISRAVEVFLKYPKTGFVFGKIQTLIESTGKLITDTCNDSLKEINDGNKFFLKFPNGLSIPHLTCLFDRKEAMKIGAYQYDILGEDWETFLKLAQNKKVGYIDRISGVYRKHRFNTTKDLDLKRIEDGFKMIESPYEMAKANQIAPERLLWKWKQNMLRRYFYKQYLKIFMLSPELKEELIRMFQKNYPLFFSTIRLDARFWFFKIFGHHSGAMKWMFTHVIKQPSFYQDLLNTNKPQPGK